ncbi:uncharacterized protein LOC132295070 [Cornus florida]|uniref:uncharacterized protein LOC132295070 n=1 Tax=Cornus florida TaxID=4283 RepID=UPI0028A293EE|nr:uncharacterized protein LOC132295070 [Cornus florida]XP_059649128.1 uncharacterized protein LOC132295070 [Cornus florida]
MKMEILIKCVIRCPKNGTDELEKEDAVEKLLQDWKPPEVPLYDVYHRKGISCLCNVFHKKGTFESKSGGYAIKTIEKTVSIQNKGQVELQLHASRTIQEHKMSYAYLHTGLVQVGVKPLTRKGLNTSVLVFLRDGRFLKFKDSLLATMETSLSDGPVYFNCYPNYPVSLKDALDTWKLYVRTQNGDDGDNNQEGSKDIAIVYRVYYKVMTSASSRGSKVSLTTGKTTFIQTNLLKDNIAVAKTVEWDSFQVPNDV